MDTARTIICIKLAPDYARFVIRDSSKLAIFYLYKICKQCKWTYSSNLYSFNIRVNSLAKRFFFDEIKGRESPQIAYNKASALDVCIFSVTNRKFSGRRLMSSWEKGNERCRCES